jgi:dTDP-4-amino-4,6-dideoxygalactose transaminase
MTPDPGAEPPFLPFFRPSIGEEEIAAVADTLRSGWLTYGPRTREFGRACADYLGASHGVPVASCSAGLFLALKALGVGPGDEVVLPPLTFTATLSAILHCGATPILADVEDATLGLDPERVAEVLTPRTRAIVPVHLAGHPCRIRELLALARARGVAVVEDAAHAFGAAVEGRRLGTFGDATVFSFYATKCITTGDGGLITTADDGLARELELLSFHGMDGNAWQRYGDRGRWYYEIVRLGWKLHLGDPAAALGLVQLRRADELHARRAALARDFTERLACLPGVTLPREAPWATHAWHLYLLRVDPEVVREGRDGVIADLAEARIGTSVHFIPLHHHPAYRELLASQADRLARTERYFRETVTLPLFPAMTDAEAQRVTDAVRASVRRRAR